MSTKDDGDGVRIKGGSGDGTGGGTLGSSNYVHMIQTENTILVHFVRNILKGHRTTKL